MLSQDDYEMAVAAALRHLFLALRAAGHAVSCELLPDPDDPDLLARLHVTGTRIATLPEVDLFSALWGRHTERAPFAPDRVPDAVLDHVRAIVTADGCALDVVGPGAGLPVAVLTARAERVLETDPALRAEQLRWTTDEPGPVGVPATRDGTRGSDVPLRRFGAAPTESTHEPPVPEDPLLLVLSTPTDTPSDWLTAGWALSDVLLTLEHQGLVASPLTQVLELPALRAQLRGALGLSSHPQMMLRVGVPGPVRSPATTRRPLHDVVR